MDGVRNTYEGEERGDAYRILVGKPEGKMQFGRHMHRWEDNIKLDLEEVGGGAWSWLICLRIGNGGEVF